VVLKGLEDEKREVLGFVLVQAELGARPTQIPWQGRDPAPRSPLVDVTAEQLRDQVQALAVVMEVHARDMPESVRAILSVIAKQLEHLSGSISNLVVGAPRSSTFPSKFDRRRK
jgi:hypothetical protein